MSGKKIGYVRVSSITQNTDRQLDGISLDKTFTDKCSGSKKDRIELNLLMDYIREGDNLYIHSLDRLARNLQHLKTIVNEINKKGVEIHFIKEGLIFKGDNSPMANNGVSKVELGKIFNISRASVYRYLNVNV